MRKYSIGSDDLPSGYADFYKKLCEIQDDIYPCKRENLFDFDTPGWVGVSRKSDSNKIELLWTSDKHYHFPLRSSHKAVMADFFEDRVEYVTQSAYRMWPVKDLEERIEIVLFLMNRVNNAIANMNQKPGESLLKKILAWSKKYFQRTNANDAKDLFYAEIALVIQQKIKEIYHETISTEKIETVLIEMFPDKNILLHAAEREKKTITKFIEDTPDFYRFSRYI